MNSNTNTTQFPQTVCNETAVYDMEKRITKDLEKVNQALQRLAEQDFHGMSHEAVNVFIKSKVEDVKNSQVLPKAIKADAIKEWEELGKRMCKDLDVVLRFLKNYPTAKDNGKRFWFEEEPKTIAKNLCTHLVPADAKSHWELIGNTLDSVRTLREWEKKHHVKKLPLIALARLTAEELAEGWENGGIISPMDIDATAPEVNALMQTYL